MNVPRTAFVLSATLAFAACSPADPQGDVAIDPAGNPGAACESSADCVTPMDYLTRSSCPFASMCVEGRCAVVCPMMEHDAAPGVSVSHSVACATDADCTCDEYAAADTGRCACVNDACVAIVQE